MTFGQNVTKYREAQGITKQALARLSGVPVNSICRAELYGTDVYLSTAIKLAKALGVGLTELAGDVEWENLPDTDLPGQFHLDDYFEEEAGDDD